MTPPPSATSRPRASGAVQPMPRHRLPARPAPSASDRAHRHLQDAAFASASPSDVVPARTSGLTIIAAVCCGPSSAPWDAPRLQGRGAAREHAARPAVRRGARRRRWRAARRPPPSRGTGRRWGCRGRSIAPYPRCTEEGWRSPAARTLAAVVRSRPKRDAPLSHTRPAWRARREQQHTQLRVASSRSKYSSSSSSRTPVGTIPHHHDALGRRAGLNPRLDACAWQTREARPSRSRAKDDEERCVLHVPLGHAHQVIPNRRRARRAPGSRARPLAGVHMADRSGRTRWTRPPSPTGRRGAGSQLAVEHSVHARSCSSAAVPRDEQVGAAAHLVRRPADAARFVEAAAARGQGRAIALRAIAMNREKLINGVAAPSG